MSMKGEGVLCPHRERQQPDCANIRHKSWKTLSTHAKGGKRPPDQDANGDRRPEKHHLDQRGAAQIAVKPE